MLFKYTGLPTFNERNFLTNNGNCVKIELNLLKQVFELKFIYIYIYIIVQNSTKIFQIGVKLKLGYIA